MSTTRPSSAADYARLGVPVGAKPDEVKRAFRQLAKDCHPDHNPNDPAAERRFKLLSASYEAIKSAPLSRISPYSPTSSAFGRQASGRAPAASVPIVRSAAAVIPSLQAMNGGDTVFVSPSDLLVSSDRSTYLAANARVHDHWTPQATVRVDYDHGYHVFVDIAIRHRWAIAPLAVGLAVQTLSAVGVTSMLPFGRERGRDARMPNHLILSRLANLTAGAPVWTVASALVVTPDGCWIDVEEIISSTPTVDTPVRVERRGEGLHAVAAGAPDRWLKRGGKPTSRHQLLASAILGGISVQAMQRRTRVG